MALDVPAVQRWERKPLPVDTFWVVGGLPCEFAIQIAENTGLLYCAMVQVISDVSLVARLSNVQLVRCLSLLLLRQLQRVKSLSRKM